MKGARTTVERHIETARGHVRPHVASTRAAWGGLTTPAKIAIGGVVALFGYSMIRDFFVEDPATPAAPATPSALGIVSTGALGVVGGIMLARWWEVTHLPRLSSREPRQQYDDDED